MKMHQRSSLKPSTTQLPSVQHRPSYAAPRHRHRRSALGGGGLLITTAEMGFDTFLPALGVKPEAAVLTSALLATGSVVISFLGNIQVESKRAELQLELERDKLFQQQLRELQGVIARYRGPLLESAIDLEQRLWHLVTDQCFEHSTPQAVHAEINYLMFTLAQFLGFIEVVRREGPRERPFLQAGNPQGSDTLSALVEAVRFVLCAPPAYLEEWYNEGPDRTHPGLRKRRSREEVIYRHVAQESSNLRIQQGNTMNGNTNFPTTSMTDSMADVDVCGFDADREAALLRVSRGHQRAIGTLMITTPMGAERHYTLSYGDFHTSLEDDPSFARWFEEMEADVLDLSTGTSWTGQGPFPVNKWTRVLLLQQLLVELMDILDPDCVRLPLDRRARLMPIAWGPLPRLSLYQKRLKELSSATDFGGHKAALQGLKELRNLRKTIDEGDWNGPIGNNGGGSKNDLENIFAAFSSSSGSDTDTSDSKGEFSASSNGVQGVKTQQQIIAADKHGMTVAQLRREEAGAALRAAVRATQLESRLKRKSRGEVVDGVGSGLDE